MALPIGETFADYRVLRLLGSGGMGEVYLVQHPRLPRRDALKVLRADVSGAPSFQKRFVREADLAAGLRHPHIIGIHDRGERDGRLWIAMDYIDGTDLDDLVRRRYRSGMPIERALPIVGAVASALDYAHGMGLLHRDVKPANIIVAEPNHDGRRVFLADFGIARAIDDPIGITTTNTAVGTVAYAAPEQLMGEDLDGRADQYALGATTYQLLTGRQLFAHSSPAVVIGQHLNSVPPALGEHRPGLAGLDDVLRIALAKHPGDRYPSCTAFAQSLAHAATSGESGRRTASAPTPKRSERRSPRPETKPYSTAVPRQEPPTHPALRKARPLWPLAVGVAVTVILFAAVMVIFAVRPWRHDVVPSQTTTASVGSVHALTFDEMRDFVAEYYQGLPSDPMAAWAKLDPYYQNQNGQRGFLDFWATIQSVELISVSPRDSTSVIARLRYLSREGHTDTEDRWLRIAMHDGTPMLHDSERIGPVYGAP